MGNSSLIDFYDELKREASGIQPTTAPVTLVGSPNWNAKVNKECSTLKDECAKRILLDIYCKVVPLDPSYVAGNQGAMKSDIDKFLTDKNMNATQYFTSCKEKVNAPLLEFIIRSCDNIGKEFIKEAKEVEKDAKENKVNVAPPTTNVENKETQAQIVDVQKDTEYGAFIEKLKEKTIKKIVDDVSKIISDKKEEKDMTFNPSPVAATESVTSYLANYIDGRCSKSKIEITPERYDKILQMIIREATLHGLDSVFKRPESDKTLFFRKISTGNGVIITESTIKQLAE